MSNSSPYDVTDEVIEPSLDGVNDLEVRSRFILYEVKVIAVGWFYYFLATFLLSLVAGILLLVDFSQKEGTEFLIILLSISSVLFYIIGYGMRKLLEWARLPSLLAAIVGMFFFPFGTIAGIYCFLLLRKSIAKEMFSERYRKLLDEDGNKSMAWLAITLGFLLGVIFWLGYFYL